MASPPRDLEGGATRLTAIYEEGVRIFHEIAQLCVDQRSALVRNDADRLGQLAERAETLGARFRLLESARRDMDGADALHLACFGAGEGNGERGAFFLTDGLEQEGSSETEAHDKKQARAGNLGRHWITVKRSADFSHATPSELRELEDARRRLSEAAATAALASAQCAELLARASAATSAIHRILEGAMSAGYLPNGELRPQPRSAFLERRA